MTRAIRAKPANPGPPLASSFQSLARADPVYRRQRPLRLPHPEGKGIGRQGLVLQKHQRPRRIAHCQKVYRIFRGARRGATQCWKGSTPERANGVCSSKKGVSLAT